MRTTKDVFIALTAIAVVLGYLLATLGIPAIVLYIAWHFVTKFW